MYKIWHTESKSTTSRGSWSFPAKYLYRFHALFNVEAGRATVGFNLMVHTPKQLLNKTSQILHVPNKFCGHLDLLLSKQSQITNGKYN